MPSTTNFQLTFGGSYSKRNDDGSYDNTFDVAKLHVSLSADGTNWNEITYTKNNGDQDRPYWVFCTADFTLKSATDKLYIRYAADEASVYRLDDMTLKAGNGGQPVDLGGSSQTVTLDVSPMEVTLGNASEMGIRDSSYRSTGAVRYPRKISARPRSRSTSAHWRNSP